MKELHYFNPVNKVLSVNQFHMLFSRFFSDSEPAIVDDPEEDPEYNVLADEEEEVGMESVEFHSLTNFSNEFRWTI